MIGSFMNEHEFVLLFALSDSLAKYFKHYLYL